ncbi:MAG: TraR/DksA C4-type zinc finger protein [Firmicutes bacterium]|nr:TraR/DksA C4-type zinc finger protein [Bacillota bacterium]
MAVEKLETKDIAIINRELWERVIAFHGHICPGVTIGYRAAIYASKLLGLKFSEDEEVVCISENDACGVDAIQVILGCSAGKGNLLFHLRGKSAYTFYERTGGKSARLVLNRPPRRMSRQEALKYYHELPDEDMFSVGPARIPLPEPAKNFDSYVCEECGELTGSNWIRIVNGRKLCMDCAGEYNRFNV